MTSVPAHQIAADLLSAANHIERFGWQQGNYGAAGKPCCTRGAMQVGIFGATIDERVFKFSDDLNTRDCVATKVFAKHVGRNVTNWNDSPGRTKDGVVAALREAAESICPNAPHGRAPHGSTETGLAYMEAANRFDGHGAARTVEGGES